MANSSSEPVTATRPTRSKPPEKTEHLASNCFSGPSAGRTTTAPHGAASDGVPTHVAIQPTSGSDHRADLLARLPTWTAFARRPTRSPVGSHRGAGRPRSPVRLPRPVWRQVAHGQRALDEQRRGAGAAPRCRVRAPATVVRRRPAILRGWSQGLYRRRVGQDGSRLCRRRHPGHVRSCRTPVVAIGPPMPRRRCPQHSYPAAELSPARSRRLRVPRQGRRPRRVR